MSVDKSEAEQPGRIKLSKADSLVFFEALENPPEPNEKLKRAASSVQKKFWAEVFPLTFQKTSSIFDREYYGIE